MTTNSPPEQGALPASDMAVWPRPDLGSPEMAATPFRYATLTECFTPHIGEHVLEWFERDAPWIAKRTDFYEQYEFSCWDSASPTASYLTRPDVLTDVSTAMTAMFGCEFEPDVSVVCHKLVRGHRIGIHNDYLIGDESHRLTIQLNRGLADTDGGFLMLFSSGDPADVHRVLRPEHLSALAFEISPDSFHAVSKMHGGARYTIIYSLRARCD
ncbi:cyclophane-containing peptide 2OG-Fe(II) oxygenase YhhC [Streptomyces sp. CBMA29]|uniref:cyclophane-containing peptide 2OG-Fe(II) oxygenase YhhC n=1 Tax=Streptomyces sp. CBMA29 TaxID=1896314 RepID=UPI001661FC11|nr:cyclophane-containing peptide 2OG-Fe(II) oxygenase YhhC [Streptomyces sp. CBMA29]